MFPSKVLGVSHCHPINGLAIDPDGDRYELGAEVAMLVLKHGPQIRLRRWPDAI